MQRALSTVRPPVLSSQSWASVEARRPEVGRLPVQCGRVPGEMGRRKAVRVRGSGERPPWRLCTWCRRAGGASGGQAYRRGRGAGTSTLAFPQSLGLPRGRVPANALWLPGPGHGHLQAAGTALSQRFSVPQVLLPLAEWEGRGPQGVASARLAFFCFAGPGSQNLRAESVLGEHAI